MKNRSKKFILFQGILAFYDIGFILLEKGKEYESSINCYERKVYPFQFGDL